LAYEHEAMHLETFLYMLLQSDRVLPPPGEKSETPNFQKLAAQSRIDRVENKWHKIPGGKVTLGLDDPENDLGPDRYFGWDNERPSQVAAVHEFEAQSRPISNGEYARFMEVTGRQTLPASWINTASSKAVNQANGVTNGTNGTNGHSAADVLQMASSSFIEDKAVRTVYGLVPLEYALDWPVMASYDELAAYARWANGRIPTLEEARILYKYVEEQKGAVEKVPSKLISAVNG
jgi:formylglycine-generating enzyme required for sulfatase activity